MKYSNKIRKTKLKKSKQPQSNNKSDHIIHEKNKTKPYSEEGREIIASAIKVNVATAMPSENVTKLELYLSVSYMYSRGIPVYCKTTIS